MTSLVELRQFACVLLPHKIGNRLKVCTTSHQSVIKCCQSHVLQGYKFLEAKYTLHFFRNSVKICQQTGHQKYLLCCTIL